MTPQEQIAQFISEKYMQPVRFAKLNFLSASDWLVEHAEKVGVCIQNSSHQITTDFITHALKEHGNAKTESARGNIALTQQDFFQIANIVSEPTFVVFGVKRDGQDRIIYIKDMQDGTALYFEEILTGGKTKTLRGKSLSKQKNKISVEKIRRILQANKRNDISKMIIAFGVAANSTVCHS